MLSTISQFADQSASPAVRGFLHVPEDPSGDALVLAHGAGSDCQSKLLIAVAAAFAEKGFLVLRCDLPFRQQRPTGPPSPAGAANDREGLRRAVEVLVEIRKKRAPGRIFLGGHSYGGRQATMLAAANNNLVDGLLLLSYPLHPPRKPAELHTAHFPQLTTPALFVHGARDPFGSPAEMEAALKIIPARHSLLLIDSAGHDLLGRKAPNDIPERIVEALLAFSN
ncbi:MAG TPA: alpha/beta fold hydrolase [Candidatus Saccharimonadales bacterium]|nr:alpha/beta fold hydrolase [Candidatus Saccharimonadales bacterium]